QVDKLSTMVRGDDQAARRGDSSRCGGRGELHEEELIRQGRAGAQDGVGIDAAFPLDGTKRVADWLAEECIAARHALEPLAVSDRGEHGAAVVAEGLIQITDRGAQR